MPACVVFALARLKAHVRDKDDGGARQEVADLEAAIAILSRATDGQWPNLEAATYALLKDPASLDVVIDRLIVDPRIVFEDLWIRANFLQVDAELPAKSGG